MRGTRVLVGSLLVAACTTSWADDELSELLETIPVEPVSQPEPEPLPADEPPSAARPAPEARSRLIEEIVVTATKRAVDVRDIPLSIDTFSGEDLRDIGATSLESVARFSPGVAVSPGLDPEAAQVIIRGVSTDTFFTFFTRTFGIFYEDVSMVNPSILGPQPNLNPFDMNVEMLKGPQGTLFGGSALSGAIRYVPNKPDFEAPYVKLASGVGTLEKSSDLSYRYDGLWNQPLGDTLAFRLVASHNEFPGYVRDLRSGQDDINSTDSTQMRGLLRWQPLARLDILFSALRRETHQDDGAFANNDRTAEHDARFFPDVLDSTTDNLMLSTQWSFDHADVVLVLSQLNKEYPQRLDYSQFIGTSLANLGLYGDTGIRSSQPSAELRIASTTPTESRWRLLRDWDYVAGYFFVYSDQFLQLDLGTELTGDALRLQGDVDAKENALFFDLTRYLGAHWELGLGGRLFRQSTKADISTTVVAVENLLTGNPILGLLPLPGNLPTAGNVSLGRDVGEIGETVFNPKFTVRWILNDDVSVFTSAVKGFRYAGANQNPTRDPNVPLFFESDDIWNYELGVRTRWLGGALQADVTVFQLEWTDLQVQQREFTGAFAYTTNVGGARNRGIEGALDLLLPGGFALKLNAAYVDARTTTYFDDFQGPAPAGTELPGSSPFSGSALLLYLRDSGYTQFLGTLSYTYQNRNYNNLPHTYEHPALGLLGASARLSFPGWPGQPAFSVVGNNLTDEFEPAVVFDTPNTGGILTIYNPPRSVVFGVEISFGG